MRVANPMSNTPPQSVRVCFSLFAPLVPAASLLAAVPARAEEPDAHAKRPPTSLAAFAGAAPVPAAFETSVIPAPPPRAESPTSGETPLPNPSAPAPSYSLPWQLRPLLVGNVVRSDTSFAKYDDTMGRGGFTTVSTLLASFKVPGTGGPGQGLAPLLRLAAVSDSPPSGTGGFAVVNPLLAAR